MFASPTYRSEARTTSQAISNRDLKRLHRASRSPGSGSTPWSSNQVALRSLAQQMAAPQAIADPASSQDHHKCPACEANENHGVFRDKNAAADGDGPAPLPGQLQPPNAGPVPADAATPCPAGQEAGTVKGCIKPVVIADDDGKNPTSATSAAKAQEIWKKCCIDFSLESIVTVNKASYKTLDESADNTPTAQEEKLFKEVASSACVLVFFPLKLKMSPDEGKDVNGGGGTYDGGSAHPKIVLVEGALPEVLAHEVGHAAGYHGHAGSDGTVMMATNHYNVAPVTDVSADVCKRARSGSILTNPGAKDCCEKIP